MDTANNIMDKLKQGAYSKAFSKIYPKGTQEYQTERYCKATHEFEAIYGKNRPVTFISAPGRTEIGGNHTDHQHGRVLAASVNLDIICTVSKNADNKIRIKSKGYDEDVIDLNDLTVQECEKEKAASLIRGVAARFSQLGYEIGGFDAYTTSDVLKGSGLSSSAAFEVAVGTILSRVFNSGRVSAVQIAQIGQYAENVYFGKPCGLMDQTASSVGGFVAIDFKDPENPVVESIKYEFESSGHTLCIVDTKGNHADLTSEYASIPKDMKSVAALFGKNFLRDVDEAEFYARIAELRGKTGDRAVLRAMHFFADNERARLEAEALKQADFGRFKDLIIESGRSSFDMLQNVYSSSAPHQQGLSVALALSERLLKGKGAWRVHGGGFAGTIQAFVPTGMLNKYRAAIEGAFGAGSCHELAVRPCGGIEVEEDL